MLLSSQMQRPLIHPPSRPRPRVVACELPEPAHQALAGADGVLPQPTGGLLRPPAPQHRLEHRVLRPQLHHARDQLKVRRARQITPSHPALQPQHQRPFEGGILHTTGSLCKRCRSDSIIAQPDEPIPEALSAGDLQVLARLMQFPRVGVDGRAQLAAVSQHLSDLGQRRPGPKQPGRQGVPQPMRAKPRQTEVPPLSRRP